MFALNFSFTVKDEWVRRSVLIPLELLAGIDLTNVEAVSDVVDRNPELLKAAFRPETIEQDRALHDNPYYPLGAVHEKQSLVLVPVEA